MRQRVTYCIAGSPTSVGEARGERGARHRELVGERVDRPVARGLAVDQRERPADVAVAQRAEPALARGRVALDPRAQRLDDEDVGEPRDDRLAAGPQLARLGGHQPQRPVHPARAERLRPPRASRIGGQRGDEPAGGRMAEPHGAADEPGRRAAAAVAEDLVARADLLALEVEDARRRARRARCAARGRRRAGRARGRRGRIAMRSPPGASSSSAPGGDDVEPDVVRPSAGASAPHGAVSSERQ